METKTCVNCKKTYHLVDFWKIPHAEDGYDKHCKICRHRLRIKKRRDESIMDLSHIRFNKLMDDDHYQSYKLLERMGYDLESEKSIHEQFCLKWGLEIKKRDNPHTRYKSWDQVKKKPQ